MMVWTLKKAAGLAAALPPGAAKALARHWGWLLAHVLRVRRRYVLATLAQCFPEKPAAERRAVYAAMCTHQALNLMELIQFAGGRDAELGAKLEMHGEEIVQAALARGHGALIMLAHYGNYDLMGLYAATLFRYPVTIITKILKNSVINQLWDGLRRKSGLNVLPAHNAYRACVRALKQNGLVGFMFDQNRPSSHGVFVDFFGRPASTTPGLAFMSAQTGAPVVPAFMRRTPEGRHVLEVKPLLEPPPDRRPETLRAATAAYTKIIEEEIRRYPEQWLWWHKRWKSRPPEEAASAAR